MKKFNYQKEYKKQVQENSKNVLNELNSKNMALKINNWAEKFGYSVEDIYNKIVSDEMFRCVFSKDPAKQNIYEKLALGFLKQIPNVMNPKKDGKTHIIYGKPTEEFTGESKSVDFIWQSIIEDETYICYAYHKHTQGNGGAQDNQFKDLKDFIRNCADPHGRISEKIYFFALCDGNYYTERKKMK